jgi:hypothetical protein
MKVRLANWKAFASALAILCLLAAVPTISLAADKDATPLTAAEIVAKLTAANARRAQALQAYRCQRHYKVDYRGFAGARVAEMQVEMTFTAPDRKDFRVISQSGTQWLINRVLLKLIESEKEAWQQHRNEFELNAKNYEFALLETQVAKNGVVYVLSVNPREKSKYVYRGKIWVDGTDFAVVRLEGEPAKSPSFWISRTQITHIYSKIGDFWFPQHNESVTQARFSGKAVLTIDYFDYKITAARPGTGPGDRTHTLPDPGSLVVDQH